MNRARITAFAPFAIIVLLGIACYANSFRNKFVWDDNAHIVDNRFLRSAVFIPRFFTTDMAEAYGSGGEPVPNYRPVWLLSLWVDFQLWQLNPFGYHLTNLLLHVGCALTLFALLRVLAVRRSVALLAAAIFVCHPVHTEAVTYMSPRSTPMSCLFMLIALLIVLRAGREVRPNRRVACVCAASCAFGLALLSKENAATFPAAVAALCALAPALKSQSSRSRLLTVGAFFGVLAVYLGARLWALTEFAYEAGTPIAERVVLALRALAGYVGLSIAPFNLHVDRLLPTDGWQATALTVAGIGTLTALSAICVVFYKRDWRIVFGIVLFAIGFSITSNLVPANTTFAERWLYWPMSGLLIAGAAGIDSLSGQQRLVRALIGLGWCVVALFAGLTIAQNRVWRDDITLYETALARGSPTVRVRTNLAWWYLQAGQLDRARAVTEEALRLQPEHAQAQFAMALLLLAEKDFEGAEAWFRRALATKPTHYVAATGLANVAENLGKLPAAERTLRVLAGDTTSPELTLPLVRFYYRQGRFDDAERVLRRVLEVDPCHASAHNFLGTLLFQKANLSEAEAAFRLALRYDRWLADAHANLAALASARGDLAGALRCYDRALQLAPQNARLVHARAVTLEKYGRLEEARRAAARALEIDPGLDDAKQMLEKLAPPAAQ
jgi:tetratricopeptide (TPR) repeat protein